MKKILFLVGFLLIVNHLFGQDVLQKASLVPVVVERGSPFQVILETKERGIDSIIIENVTNVELGIGNSKVDRIIFKDDGSFPNDLPNDNIFFSDHILYLESNIDFEFRNTFETGILYFNELYLYKGTQADYYPEYPLDLPLRILDVNSIEIPEVTSLSNESQHTEYVINYVHNVKDGQSFTNYPPNVFDRFEDYFSNDNHAILFAYAYPNNLNPSIGGSHALVTNQVEGICQNASSDNNPLTAPAESLIYLWSNIGSGLFVHEYLHRWAAYCDDTGISKFGHYGVTELSSSGFGQCVYRDFIQTGGDTFSCKIDCGNSIFNDLELYLAGLQSIDSIDWPIRFLNNVELIGPDFSRGGYSEFFKGELDSIDKAEFLDMVGPRNPEFLHYDTLKTSLIVISEQLLTPKEMAFYDFFMKKFEEVGSEDNSTISYVTAGKLAHTTKLRIDKDRDGFTVDKDCNDDQFAINPASVEIANNGIDEDCDGEDLVTSSLHNIEGALLNIYPNPVQEDLYLDYSGIPELKGRIMDVNGRVFKEMKLQNGVNKMNLNGLAKGIYFLEIVSSKTSQRISDRIIKH